MIILTILTSIAIAYIVWAINDGGKNYLLENNIYDSQIGKKF